MKEILKFKDFTRLYVANVISRFGDSIDMIAYGYMVYKLTGSKMLLATIYIFNVLPNILFSSFSGAIVDFCSKKKIIVIGDFLRSSIVILTAYLYYAKLLEPWHLFILTFLTSTVETFVSPSKSSTIPQLIDEEHYMTVNSTLESFKRIVELVGLGIAGTLLGTIGITGAMLVNALTFLVSGIIISMVNFPVEEKKEFTKSNYLNSYKEGLSFTLKNKTFLSVIIGCAILNFLLTPINALSAAYVDEILKSGPQGLSYFGLSIMFGNIVGGFLVGKVAKKFKISTLIFIGLFFSGIFYTGLAMPAYVNVLTPLMVGCLSFFMVGVFLPFCWAGLTTFAMKNVPREMYARFSAVNTMFSMSANPLGAFISGIVVTYIGLAKLILIFGGVFVLSAFIPSLAIRQFERNIEKTDLDTKGA